MAYELIGTAVAGLLLLVVVLAFAWGIDWRSDEILTSPGSENLLRALAGNPAVWGALFVGLALGLSAVAIAAVGGAGPASGGLLTAALAAFGVVVFGFLVAGTYAAARDRDVSPAGATLVTSLLVGSLLLVAVGGQLLMG